jgi:hypothetical protein
MRRSKFFSTDSSLQGRSDSQSREPFNSRLLNITSRLLSTIIKKAKIFNADASTRASVAASTHELPEFRFQRRASRLARLRALGLGVPLILAIPTSDPNYLLRCNKRFREGLAIIEACKLPCSK